MTPAVGDTYQLTEADYRFGVGPLLVRVTQVLGETVFDNEPWFDVEAMVKVPGTTGPARERQLYVRAAALHRSGTK